MTNAAVVGGLGFTGAPASASSCAMRPSKAHPPPLQCAQSFSTQVGANRMRAAGAACVCAAARTLSSAASVVAKTRSLASCGLLSAGSPTRSAGAPGQRMALIGAPAAIAARRARGHRKKRQRIKSFGFSCFQRATPAAVASAVLQPAGGKSSSKWTTPRAAVAVASREPTNRSSCFAFRVITWQNPQRRPP